MQREVDLSHRDEPYAWLTCVLALKAVCAGNFGVGSILVDPDSAVVAGRHNEVFHPRFRSDGHAEMMVMDAFEAEHQNIECVGRYRLYTSLESCPMCLTRLITAGVGEVVHVAPDPGAGMVGAFQDAPRVWRELAVSRTFRLAECSSTLRRVATEIFESTAGPLNVRLLARSLRERATATAY